MKKVTIIGGDVRSLIAAARLVEKGYCVETLGLKKEEKGIIEDSDVVVFPVPTTRDKKSVFAPFSEKEILLSSMEKRLAPHQLILTCNYRFESKICIDYGNTDGFALLNAVPTAEAAIALAIENTDFTVWQSRVLICGFGRVGKILADRLYKLGADVTVSARKVSDFAMAECLGYNYIHTQSVASDIDKFDIVFNTLDLTVIDEDALKKCRAALLIDLSTKGGFDIAVAESYGIKAIKAPGLPGKSAPITAGNILAKTIIDLIEKNT